MAQHVPINGGLSANQMENKMKLKTILKAAIVTSLAWTGAAMADQVDDIGWVYRAKLTDPAKMEQVVALTQEMANLAGGASGTLVWELSVQGDVIYGYERFDNEAAVFAHIEAITPLFPRMMELWSTDLIVPTTEVPENVRALLDQFGAVKPDMTFTKSE